MLTLVAKARIKRRHVVARATRVPCLTRRRPRIPKATNLPGHSARITGAALFQAAPCFDRG